MLKQFITFQIGMQVLGVDIMAVREIRAWSPATALPQVAPYIHGVVNLRGVILPIIDLRYRLGWGTSNPTARHVIVVLDINGQLQGVIVDAVNDIVAAKQDDIQPITDIDLTIATQFLQGVMTIDGRMIFVLSSDKLVNNNDTLQAA